MLHSRPEIITIITGFWVIETIQGLPFFAISNKAVHWYILTLWALSYKVRIWTAKSCPLIIVVILTRHEHSVSIYPPDSANSCWGTVSETLQTGKAIQSHWIILKMLAPRHKGHFFPLVSSNKLIPYWKNKHLLSDQYLGFSCFFFLNKLFNFFFLITYFTTDNLLQTQYMLISS